MSKTVLQMKNIRKCFGPTVALNDISLELFEGEVHAIVGENGAGKSTLIKVLGGIHRPDSGTIEINGKEVVMDSAHTAQKYGINIIHQEIVLVPELSISENIFLGRELTTAFGLKDIKKMERQTKQMLSEIGLFVSPDTKVGKLSIAQQQMVEITKAISFNAKILVMDEPTSSLSDEEVHLLMDIVRKLKSKGVSIIYISHRMEEIFSITDRITVIRDGSYVADMLTSETTQDKLVSLMVGRQLSNYYTRTYNEAGDEILRVENLSCEGKFNNISFSVRAGEILGFSGLVGSGRSELMQCIFGAEKFDSGRLFLNKKEIINRSSADAIKNGIAMVPEDRKKQGLTLMNSIAFNINLANINDFISGGLINKSKAEKEVRSFVDSLRIKIGDIKDPVSSLSGGNQQKVVLSKWLSTKPKVLILDEPTRGVDVGAKSEIYALINRLAKQGLAILLVSSELPEVLNMSDRIIVFCEGDMVGELRHEEADQELIMKYATGGCQ